MPKIAIEIIKNSITCLKEKKVFSLAELISRLSCSSRTAQAKLKDWKTFTSYNQNGRYHTMPDIPCFDDNGLWHFEDKYFSKYGNLKKTVIALIRNSKTGLSGREIGKMTGLLPRSFLHHFRNAPGICREIIGGFYVYFSADSNQYVEQKKNRIHLISPTEPVLSDTDIVLILTALIKHRNISLEEIMGLPEIEAGKFTMAGIRGFMEQHEVLKKTSVTKP